MRGDMTTNEAFEAGIIDNWGVELSPYTSVTAGKLKICRCCGEKGLNWQRINDKWRLYKNGKLHNCTKNPLRR